MSICAGIATRLEMPKLITSIVKFVARVQNVIVANFSDVDYWIIQTVDSTQAEKTFFLFALRMKKKIDSQLVDIAKHFNFYQFW